MEKQYSIFKLSLVFVFLLLAQSISSQCEFGFEATEAEGEVNPEDNVEYAQGFTAECSGFLEYVQFISSGSGTFSSGTIKVFSGDGVTGELLYSSEYPEQTIEDGRLPIRVEIAEVLEVEEGSQYTFQMQFNGLLGVVIGENNQYEGGSSFDGETPFGDVDFFFNVSISDQFSPVQSSQCDFSFEATEGEAEANPDDDVEYAQGFTAECSGFLKYVQFISSGAGTFSSGTIKVFSGDGVTGELLYSSEYPEQTIVDGRRPIRVEITEPLEVEQGSQYTFQMQFNGQLGVVIGENNQYEGGSAFDGETPFGDADFFFNVSISDQSLSISDNNVSLKLALFPNPSKDFIQINNLIDTTEYKIFNILGKQVYQGSTEETKKIDIRSLDKGLYLIRTDSGAVSKFIKQ
jgi:hypothetical protein